MNAFRVYVNLWLDYTLDYGSLERNAREMTDYARELGEVDPDGFIRVWVHTFEGQLATFKPSEDELHSRLHELIRKDINAFSGKRTPGTYSIEQHGDTHAYGIMYKERV